MNQENTSSKKSTTTKATDLGEVKFFTRGEVIAVKLNQSKRASAAKLSSRPSRSIIKSKSLRKPFKTK